MTLHVSDLMDVKLLEEMVAEGYVRSQVHTDLPLRIYNYAEKAQYERVWNEVTKQTRGLVLDEDGEVIILPFQKFFNYEEHLTFDELPDVPMEPFEVHEKLDGSLFLARYHEKYGLVTASRGSFISEQCMKGTQLLYDKCNHQEIIRDYSYLFEVIYPENRIVVDYGNTEELVLLGVNSHNNAKELRDGEVDIWADTLGVRPPTRYTHISELDAAKEQIPDDEEGYVIRFNSGLRMKIKGEEYVRLHRIVTGINSKHIWEWLRDGRDIDEMLVDVPDEFYVWVKKTADELQEEHDQIIDAASIRALQARDNFDTRKEQAIFLKETKYPGISFALLDDNESKASDSVWKMIKPKASWPFKVDEG